MALIGSSGHLKVHLMYDDGDTSIQIEDAELGELLILADIPTAREVRALLDQAIERVCPPTNPFDRVPHVTGWIDTGSGPGWVV